MDPSRSPPTFLPMLQNPYHQHPPNPHQGSNPSTETSDLSGRALSTSFEAITPPPEENDPVARHAVHLSSRTSVDLEGSGSPPYNNGNDPYQLSARLKTVDEIDTMRAKAFRFGPIPIQRTARKARKLHDFYEQQNENIERFLMPIDEHVRLAREMEGDDAMKLKIAVNGSFFANIFLAFLQTYAAVSSGSLSLFTTMADAIFDPLSNITLMICARAVKKVDPRRFPSGKARIETAGNIVFCFLMTAISIVIIVQSVIDIIEGNYIEPTCVEGVVIKHTRPVKPFRALSIIAVGIACFMKAILFWYCWALSDHYSQIRILWEDHRNDLVINSLGGLLSVGGNFVRWWVDPMGGILLSLLTSGLWLRTAWSQFHLLIGVTAEAPILQWITYIAMTHSPAITGIDTVRAYYSGPRIIVEVDVVMDPEASLRESHNVAEALQMKLERLPDVERAYVHVDYETSHKPEHAIKKEI